jgi:hypothetical protein
MTPADLDAVAARLDDLAAALGGAGTPAVREQLAGLRVRLDAVRLRSRETEARRCVAETEADALREALAAARAAVSETEEHGRRERARLDRAEHEAHGRYVRVASEAERLLSALLAAEADVDAVADETRLLVAGVRRLERAVEACAPMVEGNAA